MPSRPLSTYPVARFSKLLAAGAVEPLSLPCGTPAQARTLRGTLYLFRNAFAIEAMTEPAAKTLALAFVILTTKLAVRGPLLILQPHNLPRARAQHQQGHHPVVGPEVQDPFSGNERGHHFSV